MQLNRRKFIEVAAALTAGAATSSRGYALPGGKVRLGLNAYSLRALPHQTALATIRAVMRAERLQVCQLLFTQVEPPEVSPVFGVAGPNLATAPPAPPTPQQVKDRQAMTEARSAWRLSAPLAGFEDIRNAFAKDGLRIQAYATTFGPTMEEIDRMCLMTRALGATLMTGRVPEAMTDLVAAAATKHRLHVGIQVSDVSLLERQLKASPYLRANPDAGDLTKAGIDALQFVRDHAGQMDSIDLKDAIAGTGSVPFGTGDAYLREILRLLNKQHQSTVAYIDCDYPGTGRSLEEVSRCVQFARSL